MTRARTAGTKRYVPPTHSPRKMTLMVTGGDHFECCGQKQDWKEIRWREVERIGFSDSGEFIGKDYRIHKFLWGNCPRCARQYLHASTVDEWDSWEAMTPTQRSWWQVL